MYCRLMVVFIKTQPILKVLIMLFFLPYSMQKIILFCTARRIHPINFESPVRHFHGLKKLRIVSNQPFLILLLSIVKVGSELIYIKLAHILLYIVHTFTDYCTNLLPGSCNPVTVPLLSIKRDVYCVLI